MAADPPATASRATVLLLEEIAANAIAAPVVQLAGGWLLRAWPEAPFRRSSSVLPIRGDGDAADVERRIALVEHFYRARGLPVRFQVGPVVEPPDLDERLASRGYEVEAATQMCVARTSAVVEATSRAGGVEVTVAEAVDDAWLSANGGVHGDEPSTRRRVAAYAQLLARLCAPCAVATAAVPGVGAAAAGMSVLERGWAGVFAMGTRPSVRRRGLATAILHALARDALDRGAESLYLQVEADNEAALHLYRIAGFRELYGYRYRTLGRGGAPA